MQRDQTGENSGEPQENPESERETTEDDGYVLHCMSLTIINVTF